jgi:hypothetical protein
MQATFNSTPWTSFIDFDLAAQITLSSVVLTYYTIEGTALSASTEVALSLTLYKISDDGSVTGL